jgi:hypothetical protein
MAKKLTNPMFAKIVAGIEAKLDEQTKVGYQQIVVAGMKLLFSDETHQMMTQKLDEGANDLPAAIVKGTVQLIALLYQESQSKMNVGAAFPAANTLMIYIFEFAEHYTKQTFDKNVIAQATQSLMQQLLELFQISQEDLAKGAEYNQQKGAGGAPAGEPPGLANTMPPQGAA